MLCHIATFRCNVAQASPLARHECDLIAQQSAKHRPAGRAGPRANGLIYCFPGTVQERFTVLPTSFRVHHRFGPFTGHKRRLSAVSHCAVEILLEMEASEHTPKMFESTPRGRRTFKSLWRGLVSGIRQRTDAKPPASFEPAVFMAALPSSSVQRAALALEQSRFSVVKRTTSSGHKRCAESPTLWGTPTRSMASTSFYVRRP